MPHYIFLASRVFVPLCLFFIFSCSLSQGEGELLGSLESDNRGQKRNLKISESLSKKLDSDALLSSSGFKVAVKFKDPKFKDPNSKDESKGSSLVNAVFMELTKAQILDFAESDDVEFIEEDYVVKTTLFYASKQIGARQSWIEGYTGDKFGASSQKIRLAVIDTGIDEDHLDLDSKIVRKINCYQTNPCSTAGYEDENGHGTHVAGIMVGSGASCDEAGDSANIELTGTLEGLASATRYFFPAQFETDPSGNISVDISWEASSLSSATVGFQSKANAEASSTSFLFTEQGSINSGPRVVPGDFFASGTYAVSGVAETKIMPHAFVAYTDDLSASGKSFWAKVKTVVQGWGDGQPRMAGISYGSELVAIKSLGASGSGNISDVVRSLEYIASVASTENIIAVNLSFSISGALVSEVLNEAVSALISKGVAVVVSAGNEQQNSYMISSPGSVGKTITVGAVNDSNQFTSYSSVGRPLQEVTKPDVLAPGGSSTSRNYIISAKNTYSDSIWNRSNHVSITEDPYALKVGTSQAAPMVVGLMGLMASKRNATWDFSSDSDAMFFKMLICMTAFETGAREMETFFLGAPVTPERAGGIKDRVEGYGRICTSGAMSALEDGVLTDSFTFGPKAYEPKTFARKINLSDSKEYNFSMAVPLGADFDLYLFSGTPDVNGEPVLLASSALSNNPLESIVDFIPPSTASYYLVAKWVSGSGTSSFSLDSQRVKPTTPTIISNFNLDRFMRDKKIAIYWTSNVPSLSRIQYGTDGGLAEEKTSEEYRTEHYFEIDIDYENYYYVRGISSSQGTGELEISTAVSPVYRSSTYTELERDISIEDLPMVPDLGGCGRLDHDHNTEGRSFYGRPLSTDLFGMFIICLLPGFILILFRSKLRRQI